MTLIKKAKFKIEKNFITTRLFFIIIIFTFYLIFSDVASIVRIITNNVDSGSETNNS